jgi:dUTP pyrophosphatase
MKVKIVNKSNNELPAHATNDSAGLDLRSNINTVLEPNEYKLILTGNFIQIPKGYMGMVTPRSGLALKHGISIVNSPGIIDSDYIGELGVILINHSEYSFPIKVGDRIAQLIIVPCSRVEFEQVDKLDNTDRGSGGFGSTGKQ